MKAFLVSSLIAALLAGQASAARPETPPPASAAPDFDIDRLLAHPENADPDLYAVTVQALWERGDRAQAFFWYTVFVTRAGVMLGILSETREEGDEEEYEIPLGLRLSGFEALQWALSDQDMARTVVQRALDYEARLPPPPYFPGELWSAHAGTVRADMQKAMAQFPDDVEAYRRRTGRYIGPWKDAGKPLDEAWR
ncbi:hypothetical protein [Caulobacter sp. NIBR1757]|uniref:hypothetical protein n=1 Tax=Caulobacter sp. NIBR1757 TaxID=3016000 RepID=UPI0022F03A38|nr:hypothetical protein [Caulobacter sp. NIBR1757]